MPSTPYDLTLQDKTTTPTTIVDLVLWRDENGLPWWTEERQSTFTPPQPTGAVSYASKDPRFDLVWSQDDWHYGGLAPLYNPADPAHYAIADGMDMRWKGVAVLGAQKSPGYFLLRNADAEANSVAMWETGNNGAISTQAGSARSGSYGFTVSGLDVAADEVYIDLANPSIYQGRTITFTGYYNSQGVAGEDSPEAFIEDDVGSNNTSALTTTTYTFFTVTRTIDTEAAWIHVGIRWSGVGTGALTAFYIDDLAIVPTGGVVCAGIAEQNNELYGAFGRMICQWDETNDVWNGVRFHDATEATDIIEFNGNIFVAYGTDGDDEYVYGSTTSWAKADVNGDSSADDRNYAYFFTVSGIQLWKSRKDEGNGTHHHLNVCSVAVNGSQDWLANTSEYLVGSSDRHITSLTSFKDSFAIGKADGLHLFLRNYDDGTVANIIENVTNEFQDFVDSENFSRSGVRAGKLYLNTAQQGLFAFDGFNLVDVSGILDASRLTSDYIGGRVRAMAAGVSQLFALVDKPIANATANKDVYLVSIRQDESGRFLVHPLDSVLISDINTLAINNSSGTPYLWAIGRRYNAQASAYEASIHRWTLPQKTWVPAFEPTPVIETSGTFITSYYAGDMPDEQKALASIRMGTEGLDGQHTIQVEYEWDYSGSWTTWGTTSTSAVIQTLSASAISSPETNAIGRVLRLRFTLTTDDTVSPKLYWFAVHMTLRPSRVRTWTVRFMVGQEVVGRHGLSVPVDKATTLTNLNTLETQVYPIAMLEDFNGDDAFTSAVRVQVVEDSLRRLPAEEAVAPVGTEVWEVQLREVLNA